jgi:hypothetical protein
MYKRLLTIILLLCFVISIAGAQDDNALQYGVVTSGQLTAMQNSINYTFEAANDAEVYITMLAMADGFDPLLRLFDSKSALVSESDYADTLALIGPLSLVAGEQYTVIASSQEWNESVDEFSIMVDNAGVVALTPGDEYTETLESSNQLHFLSFDAQAGELFGYDVYGNVINITVVSPGGQEIFDDGYFENPGLPLSQLPESGKYSVILHSLADGGTDYQLWVYDIEPIILASGDVLSGTINSQEPLIFAFDSQAEKTWLLESTLPDDGDRFMAILFLQDREWWDIRLVDDYGSGPGGNPRISPFIAPENGTYYVMLYFESWESDDFSGDYTITIRPDTVLSLAPGTEVIGTITEDSGTMAYSYNGTAGEQIHLTFTRLSEGGSPLLAVYSQQGEVIVFTGYDVSNATIDVELPLDGGYRFVMQNIDFEAAEMQFSLLLERVESK